MINAAKEKRGTIKESSRVPVFDVVIFKLQSEGRARVQWADFFKKSYQVAGTNSESLELGRSLTSL